MKFETDDKIIDFEIFKHPDFSIFITATCINKITNEVFSSTYKIIGEEGYEPFFGSEDDFKKQSELFVEIQNFINRNSTYQEASFLIRIERYIS